MSEGSGRPPDDRGAAIHAGLLRGDAEASAILFELHYERVLGRLRARYRAASHDLVEDAVVQAFTSYAMRPGQYDPAQRSLRGFLAMAAERDLRNLLAREGRRSSVAIDCVELRDLPRNNEVEDAMDAMVDAEEAAELERKIVRLVAEPAERRVLALMRDGVRATAPYAEALGLSALPQAEQRRRVKQAKDRLKKRLARSDLLAGGGGG
jgi:DNA-directed RNA polymerase specialized sigma24 family protein